jgi:hypothetical protein
MLDKYPWENHQTDNVFSDTTIELSLPELPQGNYRLRVLFRHPCGVELVGPYCDYYCK